MAPRARAFHGGGYRHVGELADAVADAHVIYTDSWPHDTDTSDVAAAFAPLKVTAGVLAAARDDAVFLPCPTVTRGQEVSADALESPTCRAYEAKEWLLYAQTALLEQTLAADG